VRYLDIGYDDDDLLRQLCFATLTSTVLLHPAIAARRLFQTRPGKAPQGIVVEKHGIYIW